MNLLAFLELLLDTQALCELAYLPANRFRHSQKFRRGRICCGTKNLHDSVNLVHEQNGKRKYGDQACIGRGDFSDELVISLDSRPEERSRGFPNNSGETFT